MSFQMSMSHSYYTFFSIDSPGNQTIVSRSQTFRLTAEGLESMVAFICQDPPMSDLSNNHHSFVLFSVTFRGVEYRHNKTLRKTLWHILKILCRKLEIFHILLKIQRLVDPDKPLVITVVNSTAFFFREGVWRQRHLCFQVECYKNVTHMSPEIL